ncbi:M20/M25/M40 family metallo-hydrolase [Geitlerinema calcuttense]|uniref:M20/M25/M40 family metallo-hydrolase n=1 Tax=Geitlerinema calcuttense NRMC-F 0142 TaxID=2922238 RepID=A0ABT7LX55_9CYAN|nr:M20/M25/M40 family metallo-hydrolase [Geitlerinema calcuttense]MDL5056602.1 M20/M25/M40 family metallo-hydrolase [Geitlerinema calcuttense NRMC-F 0142]
MKKPASVIHLLQDLVSICSVNPDGEPGVPRAQANEAQIARYLSDYFSSIGLDTKLQTVYPNRPNVIGSTKSARGKLPRIILCPHIDTVSVGGMTISPFDPKIKAGKLYGRGSSDTKGPLAAMLWALTEILKKIPPR